MMARLLAFLVILACTHATVAAELNDDTKAGGCLTNVSAEGISDSNDIPSIVFVDGLSFGEDLAVQATQALAKRMGRPVGRFNIKYAPVSGISLADALTDNCLSMINDAWKARGKNGLLILFLAGNNQFINATRIAQEYNRKYESLSVLPVANQMTEKLRQEMFIESQRLNVHPFQLFLQSKGLNYFLQTWEKQNL